MDNHNWDEVCEMLMKAMQTYNEDSVKGFRGFFRRGGRNLGDNSSTFKSWLDLLPTESHYLSILCGGLKLILGGSKSYIDRFPMLKFEQAASRISNIRSHILLIVTTLPSNLTYTEVLLKEFQHSKELHERSADLYVAIAEALESIVGWCRKHVTG